MMSNVNAMKARMLQILLSTIDTELKEVEGDISNNKVWASGSDTHEEEMMFDDNIADLKEYKAVLLSLREQLVEGELNV